MFSESSWSPPEIHIFVPWMRKASSPPSGSGTAFVVTSPNEEPTSGSDRHMVPKKRPSSSGRTYFSICSSVPYSSSRLALAMVSIG